MEELTKSPELSPKPKLYQIGTIPFRDGQCRVVVVQIFEDQPNFVGTSEILSEGTETERLGIPGTTPLASFTINEEYWSRQRTVDGLVATFGEDYREYAEQLLPMD